MLIKVSLYNLWRDEDGQDFVEYSLLLAFLALVTISLLNGSATSISGIWQGISNAFAGASASSGS
ncbi:MAG: Flp family type IVb pilin [Acidobacteriaceae bacterium]|nr:Flp family type IVb pilin [Acidobacteriaceae bacterium]